MIAWVSYTLIVSACVLTAAYAADWLARLARRPVRFVWLAAAILVVVLPAVAPLRARGTSHQATAPVSLSSLEVLQTSVASVGRRVPASALWYVVTLWLLVSLGVAFSFTIAYVRLRRARRRWPLAELHGQCVRFSADVGPIVVGLVRPEIILPRWVLSRTAEEQRVIIAHESAHVAASDPLLLGIACASVALVPWNPALWLILARLRLAVELDCDARVLRGGVSPRSYGSLLVDVAESALPLRFAATALTDDTSHLEQRIIAMQTRRFTRPLLRGGSAALLAIVALLAACEAKMPTSTEIDALDARGAVQSVHSLGLADSIASWTVDGVATSAVDARKIAADSIVTVNVVKSGTSARINIVTKRGAMAGPAGEVVARTGRHAAVSAESSGSEKSTSLVEAHPIVFIDGVRSDATALKALDRSRIETVNVIKGKAATEQYGADAIGGAIVVTTKSGR